LVLGAATWLHVRSIGAPFFADDFLFLDQARGRSLLATLARPDPIGNYFRPVSRQIWFWCVAAASGESARVFHVLDLLVFLSIVALVARIAQRLLPAPAALGAAALVAVHHAADVPVLWASGSQDLLAILGALLAIDLYAAGRRGWAALPMALALLSKETVVFAPLVVVVVARPPRERWGSALARAWPLFATLGAWALLWLGTSSRRPAIGLEARPEPAAIPAALAHLLQTAVGLEWPLGEPARSVAALPPAALLLALAGIALVTFAPRESAPPATRRGGAAAERPSRVQSAPRSHVLVAGAVWALLGSIPVVAVAGIWSAYYYLFALCGVALVAGALVARGPAWLALVPALVAGTTSESARRLPEFATQRGVWTTQSHLNRHYLERGMVLWQRCLADLELARPTLPRASTLYFAALPAAMAFQSADGPLIRWAYRDSSLRSYYLTRFRLEAAQRGPVLFFQMSHGRLIEVTGPDSLEHVGLGLVTSDAPEPARDVLILAHRNRPVIENAYRAAWAEAACGDQAARNAWLEQAQVRLDPGPTPEVPIALAQVAAGDTARALALMSAAVWRHGLDPGAHALMSDLLLSTGQLDRGMIEAYAARLLAPEEPSMWRRWGMVETVRGARDPAARALERYLDLAGPAGHEDQEVRTTLATLRRELPGGDLAQRAIQKIER
jgi:hypothetical protein